MIDRIRGRLLGSAPTGVVIEVGGIAFALAVPLNAVECLGGIGDEIILVTYLHDREDALELFGFCTQSQRDLFVRLIKLSGVGPKLALAVLSHFEPEELAQVIMDGDVFRLTSVPGIGRRTAERLVVELRDRLKMYREFAKDRMTGKTSPISEAIRALEVLGIPLAKAEKAVQAAQSTLGQDAPIDELIRQALRK